MFILEGNMLFPSPGTLPNPGMGPASLALQADSLLTEPPSTQEALYMEYYSAIKRRKSCHL